MNRSQEEEFGCEWNVRFLSQDSVTAYDPDGKVILCSREGCQEKGAAGLIGAEYSVHYCSAHFEELCEQSLSEKVETSQKNPVLLNESLVINKKEV